MKTIRKKERNDKPRHAKTRTQLEATVTALFWRLATLHRSGCKYVRRWVRKELSLVTLAKGYVDKVKRLILLILGLLLQSTGIPLH